VQVYGADAWLAEVQEEEVPRRRRAFDLQLAAWRVQWGLSLRHTA